MSDYMSTEYTVLETELGRLLLWSNGQRTDDNGRPVDQWGIRTEHQHNLPPRGSDITDVDDVVTVNRVQWHFHGFGLIDQESGEIVKAGDVRSYDARRADYKEASYESRGKAEAKIYAALLPALVDFYASEEGRAFFSRARYREANNEGLQLAQELDKLQKQAQEILAKIEAGEAIMAANKAS